MASLSPSRLSRETTYQNLPIFYEESNDCLACILIDVLNLATCHSDPGQPRLRIISIFIKSDIAAVPSDSNSIGV